MSDSSSSGSNGEPHFQQAYSDDSREEDEDDDDNELIAFNDDKYEDFLAENLYANQKNFIE